MGQLHGPFPVRPDDDHPFHFYEGDRVQWGQWGGITGTVHRGFPASLFVMWDDSCLAKPTCLPVNFELRFINNKREEK